MIFLAKLPRGAVAQMCSVKKLFLKISQNSRESTCIGVSFLIKLQALQPATLLKETPTEVFSCGFCEILKITFFHKTLPVVGALPLLERAMLKALINC